VLEIVDKKGIENVMADYLSCLPIPLRYDEEYDLPIDDPFPDDHLLALVTLSTPWYVDL